MSHIDLAKRVLLLSEPDANYERIAQQLATAYLNSVAESVAFVNDVASVITPDQRAQLHASEVHARTTKELDNLKQAYETLSTSLFDATKELSAIEAHCNVEALSRIEKTSEKVAAAIRVMRDVQQYVFELERFARANQAMTMRVTNRGHCTHTVDAAPDSPTCGLVAGHDGAHLAAPERPPSFVS